MKLPRRTFLHMAAGAAALPVLPRIAWSLDYPTRPVRIIVGFPAGTAPDITGRVIAQSLSERLGQQFTIDNRPGAASSIATETVAKAPSDAYTLLLALSSNVVNAALYTNLSFKCSPRHRASCLRWRESLCPGGYPFGAGQNTSRVYRLFQGQSGQDQHGFAGNRNYAPCMW